MAAFDFAVLLRVPRRSVAEPHAGLSHGQGERERELGAVVTLQAPNRKRQRLPDLREEGEGRALVLPPVEAEHVRWKSRPISRFDAGSLSPPFVPAWSEARRKGRRFSRGGGPNGTESNLQNSSARFRCALTGPGQGSSVAAARSGRPASPPLSIAFGFRGKEHHRPASGCRQPTARGRHLVQARELS
jgi:hypothetical protein